MTLDIRNVLDPPRQPGPLARKLVCGFPGGGFVLIFIGGIFLLVGMILLLAFNWRAWEDVTLTLIGQDAQGVVVSTEIDHNTKINNKHPTIVYYEAPDGSVGESSSTEPWLHDLQPEEPIDLEVAPGFGWSRVEGTSVCWAWPFGLFVAIFPGIGGLLVFGAFWVRGKRRRAYRRGWPVVATIYERGLDHSVRINNKHPHIIRWRFTLDDGGTHEGSLSNMDESELRPLGEENDEIMVLYEPENPGNNTVYLD